MKQKLINKNSYEKICSNCFHGRMRADEECVLCVNRGIMKPDSTCKSYKYDPLKRKPKKRPDLPDYSPEEFKL